MLWVNKHIFSNKQKAKESVEMRGQKDSPHKCENNAFDSPGCKMFASAPSLQHVITGIRKIPNNYLLKKKADRVTKQTIQYSKEAECAYVK